MDPGMLTKSGIMCGLGEEWDELLVAMRDLRAQDVDILTIGQYLRPSSQHLPIARYYTPDEFAALRRHGLEMGYRHVEAGELDRKSTRLNSSHVSISYAVFCLKKKKIKMRNDHEGYHSRRTAATDYALEHD